MATKPDEGKSLAVIGERIAARRKELRLTQKQLAELAKVDQSVISRWEKGQVPEVGGLLDLADALSCSVDYLLGRTDVPAMMGEGEAERMVAIIRAVLDGAGIESPVTVASMILMPDTRDKTPLAQAAMDDTEVVGSMKSSKP